MIKDVKLYSLIGLFIGGVVVVVTLFGIPKSVFAADIQIPASIVNTPNPAYHYLSLSSCYHSNQSPARVYISRITPSPTFGQTEGHLNDHNNDNCATLNNSGLPQRLETLTVTEGPGTDVTFYIESGADRFWFSVQNVDGVFYVNNGIIVPDPFLTSFFRTISVSTTTRTVTTTGYINPAGLALKPIGYNMVISTPIYSVWYQDYFFATTSGTFSFTTAYTGSYASTTIEEFTFTGTLSQQFGNPFNENDAYTILDTISATTFGGLAHPITPEDIEAGIAETCKPWSDFWSLGLCIHYLVYPSKNELEANIQDVHDIILSRAPIGYVVRIIDILSSTTTTAIPSISYTFPSDVGGPLDGQNISFNVDTIITNAGSLIAEMKSNTTSPKTAWEIFGPFIKIFLAIILLYGMIHDVTGLKLIHHRR